MLIVTNPTTIFGITFISCFTQRTQRDVATQRLFTIHSARRVKSFELKASPLSLPPN